MPGSERSALAPARIREAARRVAKSAAASLWVDASYAHAQRLGFTDDEYLEWVEAGVWNLSGDPAHLATVTTLVEAAGKGAWVFVTAGYTTEEAVQSVAEMGAEAAIEAAQVLVALAPESASEGTESGDSGLRKPPSPPKPINFS